MNAESNAPVPPQPRFPGRMRRGLMLFVAIGLAAVFLFSQSGRHFFLADLMGNFRIQMCVLLLLGGWGCWTCGLPRVAGGLMLATLWLVWGFLPIYLPADQPPPGPEVIRIMSFNVQSANSDTDSVLQRIASVSPDVLVILEYDARWNRELAPLNADYPFRHAAARWHSYGIGIFSKYPLDDSVDFALLPDVADTPMAATSIQIGPRSLRLAALHTVSPTNRVRWQLRNDQLRSVAQTLTRNRQPTILVGDFNNTPWSPFQRDLINAIGYRDSRQGFGVLPTWHQKYWPIQIPIDHALVSEAVHVHRRWVAPAAGSDHFPIVIDVSVSPEPAAGRPGR